MNTLLPLCLLLTLVVAPSAAATSRAALPAAPRVLGVRPLELTIGQELTITGTGFIRGRHRNTVVFKRDGQRAVFVKAVQASATRLVVRVPTKLAPFLSRNGGEPQPTRFRLRVLSRRFANVYTATKLSPRIAPAPAASATAPADTPPAGAPAGDPAAAAVPGAAAETPATPPPPPDCDADGQPDSVDADDDNDQLTDAEEGAIGTSACAFDSDGDGISDAFEYESAIDLNRRALPYPGKRPYPNALDGSDGNVDFDQDGLTQAVEYTLWRKFGGGVRPLNYSDGDQDTLGNPPTGIPAATYPDGAFLDIDADTRITDDERDEDRDGLTNWDEVSGRMVAAWWGGAYDQEKHFVGHPQAAPLYEPSFIDPDTDGDGVLDGYDDQDHDGLNNREEIDREPNSLWVHPYNPCLPQPLGVVCSRHPPFVDPWAPFEDNGLPWLWAPGGINLIFVVEGQ